MSKSINTKKNQIAKIPTIRPMKLNKDENSFLQPKTGQQMWQNIYFLMGFYQRGGYLSKNLTQKIIRTSIQLIKNQPNVLYLSDPITIVGDIHGQFFDLLKHLENMKLYSLVVQNGKSSFSKRGKVLLLGDYVDRGNFSVEVVLFLLVLKIYLPKTFYLLRGNHESRQMTQMYNFKRQSKYNAQSTYEFFIDLFSVLPLAAVVNGTFFCIHGGLSEQLNKVKDIEKVNRFGQIPRKGLICDLMWADPTSDENGRIKADRSCEFNDNRNCSIKFGAKMLHQFFQSNQLMCLIRAHEVQDQGYQFLNWQGQTRFPSVITLFSAPNYCGGLNKGAIATINSNIIDIYPLQKLPQPFVLPNFICAFQLSFPFMIAQITQLFFYLLKSNNNNYGQSGGKGNQLEMYLFSKNDQNDKNDQNSKNNIDQQDQSDKQVQQKILMRQEILLGVYSKAQSYIAKNIKFRYDIQESGSKKQMLSRSIMQN